MANLQDWMDEQKKAQTAAPLPASQQPVFSENEPEQELLMKAILGLAPTLIGSAFGGYRGGQIGADVGSGALQTLSVEEKNRKFASKEKEKEALAKQEKEFEKLAKVEELKLKKEEMDRRSRESAAERGFKKEALAQENALKGFELAAKGKKEKEPNSDQSKAALFARRLRQSENVFQKLVDADYDRSSSGERFISILPGELKSGKRLSQDQRERNFVNAILRRESGAAIAPSEFASAEMQYFPRPGDDKAVLEQKKMNRIQAIAGLEGEAGPIALGRVPLIGDSDGGQSKESQKYVSDLMGQSAHADNFDPIIEQTAKANGVTYKEAEYIMRNKGYGK